MKTAVNIKNNIDKVVKHATNLLLKDRDHYDSDKNIYWVFFDKNHKPYWMVDISNFEEKDFCICVYTVNDKSQDLAPEDIVATQDFIVIKNYSKLDLMEVMSKEHANKKIGSTLIDLFEYISFINGAKTTNGTAFGFRSDIINQENLLKFYKSKEYKLKTYSDTQATTFSKQLDPKKIKDIATNIITVIKENLAFKILVPDNLKKEVVKLIKEEKNLNNYKKLDDNNKNNSEMSR